jgi:hypothetical protein
MKRITCIYIQYVGNAVLLSRAEYWTLLVVTFKFRRTLKLATPIFSLKAEPTSTMDTIGEMTLNPCYILV